MPISPTSNAPKNYYIRRSGSSLNNSHNQCLSSLPFKKLLWAALLSYSRQQAEHGFSSRTGLLIYEHKDEAGGFNKYAALIHLDV